MLTPELEKLIELALEDGVVTEKERSVLMRKAKEAGADLDEFEMILDAKICQVQKASTPISPKSNNNYGEVRKCPACGATVTGFSTTCPECGYEFHNAEAVKSANTLFEKLQALEMEKAHELALHEESKAKQLQDLSERQNSGSTMSKLFSDKADKHQEREDMIRALEKGATLIEKKYLDRKLNLIKVFAVPNTKEDLLELLSMASSGAYDNDGVIGPEEEVWIQKTDQIYQKLLVCAAGDTTTLNQATNMIVSLIKRLPAPYKNFTRIPKELRDRINLELKAQEADKKAELKENVLNILKGWRGITLGVAILLFIVDGFLKTEVIRSISFIVIIVMIVLIYRAIKEAKKDLLY